jgi:hypothetical protein
MINRGINCAIDKAARSAILLVDGRTAQPESKHLAASSADNVVLFDATALVSALSEHFVDAMLASTRHHFRMLLDHFVADDGHEHICEALVRFLGDRTSCTFRGKHLALGDPDQAALECDRGSIDRALVWGEPELKSPLALWSALDRRPVRGIAARCRYLFLAETGAEDEHRRGYVVFVQSAPRSDHSPYRAWIRHRAPAVLKLEPHTYCDDSFALSAEIRAEARPRELLMCVVPLDPPARDEDADLALDRLAGLLCHRVEHRREGDDLDIDAADVSGSHEAWLSLRSYSDLFLGDGERRRLLDARLAKGARSARDGQADPGLA